MAVDVGREWRRILQSPRLNCLDECVALLCLQANASFVNIPARNDFDDHNSCTFGHKLGKRLVGDYRRSICKDHVLQSPLAFVVFRVPSYFVLAHLPLRQFPRTSLIPLGAYLTFRRFFRYLWRVRS